MKNQSKAYRTVKLRQRMRALKSGTYIMKKMKMKCLMRLIWNIYSTRQS